MNSPKKARIKKQQIEKLEAWEYVNTETWEVTQVTFKESPITFKSKRKYMKIWMWDIPKTLYSEIWDDMRYIEAIRASCWADNSVNIQKFKSIVSVDPSTFSRIKKRLKDKWVILDDKATWVFYLNPLLWVQDQEIRVDLWKFFKENGKTFWVETL